MIEIQSLHKRFGDRVLFREANLTIKDGDFVIFTGPSGCGKTTLLNMIGALEPIDSGKIFVDGVDISQRKNQQAFFGEKVGFLFQNFALIEDKTVKANLEMIRPKNRSDVTIEEALQQVGLSDKLDHKVYTLSGGEQQRIALARLMIKKCDIILADEPTGSLDAENAATVMGILKDLNKANKTVILVTHDEKIKQQGRRVISLCRE